MPSLARINVAPIKGTALHHPERVRLTSVGIPENRRFFLIDERDHLFSGSDFGPLVQVRAEHDPERGHLSCTFPEGRNVEGETSTPGGSLTIDFYGRPVTATVVDGPFEAAFSDLVGAPLRLVRAAFDGDGSDVHHLSLVSWASVRSLAEGAGHDPDLDPRRFRINLELEGCEPYEEDTWHGSRVRIGTAVVRVHAQIPRCVVTTEDPRTGLKDFETLKEIARQRERIPDGGLPFGMYAEVEEPGAAAVGDPVTPL